MITFLGGIITDAELQWFKNKTKVAIPYSSDTHQKSIIESIRLYEDIEILSICPSGFFPKRFKKAFISEMQINDRVLRLKSCNIPVVRVFYNIHSQKKGIEKSIKQGSKAIICYMPFYHRMRALYSIKKKYPNIAIIVIVPDLVEHSYSHKGSWLRQLIVKTLRRLESKKINQMATSVDGFVYLAEKMKDKYGQGKPYMVQEAIYNTDLVTFDYQEFRTNSDFVFTYCGKIDSTNGIDRLLKAFSLIDNNNAKLYLCGDGVLLDQAKRFAQNDERIVVFGQIPHDEVVMIEQNSTVLVNPRYTSIENSAYSFPSKLIEYLACGRPVISSHLPGIPEDYDDHVFYIANDDVNSLKTIMEEVMELSDYELNQIGKENAKFVINNKSSAEQGKKLVDFIKGLENNANKPK